MKKIVVMPVKNEDWILEKSLAAACLWADHVIVADQNSTDGTKEICKKFPKVVVVPNASESFNEGQRRQFLLNAAREFSGNNVIFALDADEIISGDSITEQTLEQLISQMKPGSSAELPWIQLWKSPVAYRHDASVWSNSYKHFVYFDDRQMSFTTTGIHLPRVPESSLAHSSRNEGIKVLHYQFVVWSRMLAKQRFYRVLEKIVDPHKSSFRINARYRVTTNERNMRLLPVPDQWLAPYRGQGIDLEHFTEVNLYPYEVEVLRAFGKFGTAPFRWLDIWDIDWDQKKQIALQEGFLDIPSHIGNPQFWYMSAVNRFLDSLIDYGRTSTAGEKKD